MKSKKCATKGCTNKVRTYKDIFPSRFCKDCMKVKSKIKAEKKIKKRQKKIIKILKRKEYVRNTTKYKKSEIKRLTTKADLIFSKYIRDRDRECVLKSPECKGPLQNGHLIRRGQKATRFSVLNCNVQCSFHNCKHNQYPELYTQWFIRKYGQQMYDALVEESKKIFPFTKEYLESIINKYEKR